VPCSGKTAALQGAAIRSCKARLNVIDVHASIVRGRFAPWHWCLVQGKCCNSSVDRG
jgi:hypothetical protein